MPGGKTRQVYVKKKTRIHGCAKCGAQLKGIPRLSSTKAKNSPKTEKRPERPYGGFLCNRCAREKLKREARLK